MSRQQTDQTANMMTKGLGTYDEFYNIMTAFLSLRTFALAYFAAPKIGSIDWYL
jgi:hypothetical protein